tara:strand:+ start:1040 stop:1447 length:408 start_codon:yes stop_codon:yes gene_type:complete
MREIYVTDIKLASILDAYGVPKRQPDPVTREIRRRGGKDVETGMWWYDVADSEHADKAKELTDAYYASGKDWAEYTLDKEHPLYWIKGAFENREANLNLYHHGASPMRVIEEGDRTIYIGARLSDKNKNILKKAL